MLAACLLGLQYFTVVFTFAFAMGVIRVLLVAPRLGPTAAVLIEVPILVLASWIVAHSLLRSRTLTLTQCAAMGAIAFTLTLMCEAALAALILRESLGDWASALVTPLGLIGLAGQIVFGIMPIFVGVRQTNNSPST